MTATALEGTTFPRYEANRGRMAVWAKAHYIDEFALSPRRLLDVGCGNGFWASIFAEHGFEVYGFDKNESFLRDGREKYPELTLVQGDVDERFPVGERFPIVFCRTLPHFFREDLGAGLRVMERLLDATAGCLLLSFWTDESRAETDKGFWYWAAQDFRELVEAAGGRVGRIVRADGYLQMLVYPPERPGVRFKRGTGAWGNYPQAFSQMGLDALEEFLSAAKAVVPMEEAVGSTETDVVAMRHDVDHSLEHALTFARWEAERDLRSTYFLLHTAHYYRDKTALYAGMEELVSLGHEVGLHVNAVIEARARNELRPMDGGANPVGDCRCAAEIVADELAALREQGFRIVGTAAHGDSRGSKWGISNLDLWAAGYAPADFGLLYEAYHLHRTSNYLTDNGGRWYEPLHMHETKPTHVLTHPIHWPVNE